MLSKGAFNALLKIMEEPPEYLFFVLATTEINKVPDTIVSRCQVFNFKRLSVDDIVSRLKYIADQEQIAYEDEGLRLIAKLSSGAMRDGIKYLEQVSMLGKITADHVSQFLGVVSDSVLQAFLDILQTGTFEQLSTYLDGLVENGTDMSNFTKDLLLRLDEHFMENPSLYGKLATMLKEIYQSIKNYPYPVLIYKSKFYLYFTSGESEGGEKKSSADTTSVKREEKKGGSEEQEEESKIKKEIVDVSDLSVLKEKLVEKVEKKMVRSLLQDYAMIHSLENNLLHIVVINQAYYTSLQKPETSKYIEDIVSEMLGHAINIHWKYMTKEEYLASTLE